MPFGASDLPWYTEAWGLLMACMDTLLQCSRFDHVMHVCTDQINEYWVDNFCRYPFG
jgi:hypothetical protein